MTGDRLCQLPTLGSRRASRLISAAPPRGRGPRDWGGGGAAWPRPRPGGRASGLAVLRRPARPRREGAPGRGDRPRRAQRGAVISLPRLPDRREREAAGGGGGEGGRGRGNFPLFSFIPPGEEIRRGAGRWALSTGCAATGWLCARSAFSNSPFRFTPGPGADPPAYSAAQPPRLLRSGRTRPAGLSLGRRAAAPGQGVPARPYLRVTMGPGQPAGLPLPPPSHPRLGPSTRRATAHTQPRSPEPSRWWGVRPAARAGRGAYPGPSAGRTRSFSAPRPSFCGGAGAGTRAGPWPARLASPPWAAAAGRAAARATGEH